MIKIVSLQLNSILLNRKLPVAIHARIRNNRKGQYVKITRIISNSVSGSGHL